MLQRILNFLGITYINNIQATTTTPVQTSAQHEPKTKFTQINKTNVSRCNGCAQRCQLGIKKTKNNKYLPTIDNKLKQKYRDKNGIQHSVRPDNAAAALSFARTISNSCEHYTPPTRQESAPMPQTHCQGCNQKCKLAAAKTENCKFLPRIGQKTVKFYLTKSGHPKHTPEHNTKTEAINYANSISRLCDHYTYQQAR